MQMHAAALHDALVSLQVPPHALFTQPQHAGTSGIAFPGAAVPPRPPALATSPFVTTLELPPHQLPTADSLLQGAHALPPPLSLKTHEGCTSSVNDSARSCLTAAGSTPTAVDRPTLSRLLSNPVFAVPAAMAGAGAPAAGSHAAAENSTRK